MLCKPCKKLRKGLNILYTITKYFKLAGVYHRMANIFRYKNLWLNSYHENIIHELIIATLLHCTNQVASVCRTLIRDLFY